MIFSFTCFCIFLNNLNISRCNWVCWINYFSMSFYTCISISCMRTYSLIKISKIHIKCISCILIWLICHFWRTVILYSCSIYIANLYIWIRLKLIYLVLTIRKSINSCITTNIITIFSMIMCCKNSCYLTRFNCLFIWNRYIWFIICKLIYVRLKNHNIRCTIIYNCKFNTIKCTITLRSTIIILINSISLIERESIYNNSIFRIVSIFKF